MKICILETGLPPAGLELEFGRYSCMMQRMLCGRLANASYSAVPVYAGGKLPELESADAYIVTGSCAGVYEPHEWIPGLVTFIRRAHQQSVPMVGICFGHQIMAYALGGKVEKSDNGWGAGVLGYDVYKDYLGITQGAHFRCAGIHQDQVTIRPPSATLIAGSSFCPNAVLAYEGHRALSMQMHPEFSDRFLAAMVDHHAPEMPSQTKDKAVRSLALKSDRGLLIKMIADVFSSGLSRVAGPVTSTINT